MGLAVTICQLPPIEGGSLRLPGSSPGASLKFVLRVNGAASRLVALPREGTLPATHEMSLSKTDEGA